MADEARDRTALLVWTASVLLGLGLCTLTAFAALPPYGWWIGVGFAALGAAGLGYCLLTGRRRGGGALRGLLAVVGAVAVVLVGLKLPHHEPYLLVPGPDVGVENACGVHEGTLLHFRDLLDEQGEATFEYRLQGVSLGDGATRWQRTVPGGTCTIADGVLVTMVAENRIAGLDPTTGEPLWTHRMRYAPDYSSIYGVVPVIGDGVVVLNRRRDDSVGAPEAGAVGLDLRTGRILWEVGGEHLFDASRATRVTDPPADLPFVLQRRDDRIRVLDVSTGEPLGRTLPADSTEVQLTTTHVLATSSEEGSLRGVPLVPGAESWVQSDLGMSYPPHTTRPQPALLSVEDAGLDVLDVATGERRLVRPPDDWRPLPADDMTVAEGMAQSNNDDNLADAGDWMVVRDGDRRGLWRWRSGDDVGGDTVVPLPDAQPGDEVEHVQGAGARAAVEVTTTDLIAREYTRVDLMSAGEVDSYRAPGTSIVGDVAVVDGNLTPFPS